MGSKKAGIFNIMVPRKNQKSIDKIKMKKPEILENVNIIIVDTIKDILQNGLVKNNVNFNFY